MTAPAPARSRPPAGPPRRSTTSTRLTSSSRWMPTSWPAGPGIGALHPRLRRPPARHRRAQDDEPAVCGGEHALADRREGGSPAAQACVRHRDPGPRDRRGRRCRGRGRRCRRPGGLGRGGRQGSPGASRHVAGHRRRISAGGGARCRPCDEPGARQRRRDGDLRSGDRSRATGADRFARRSDDGDGGRHGRTAGHPRRQSGVLGAGRPEVRGAAGQGAAGDLSRALRRRDRAPVPLEHR